MAKMKPKRLLGRKPKGMKAKPKKSKFGPPAKGSKAKPSKKEALLKKMAKRVSKRKK